MELSNCNWKYNCKTVLAAALILALLCSHGSVGCAAWSAGSPGAARTLLPDVRGEAMPFAYGDVQEREKAGSSGASSLSAAFTPPVATTPPSSPGGVGSERTGADGRRAPVFQPAADLKTATATRKLLLGAGATATTQATSKPSCTSNHVPCQPPVHV